MADEILSALQGMQQSPSETYWGIGQQALGKSLPELIDPVYGDRGTNIGIALGGALVQGLLGYQARQEAAERNLQASQLANALIQLETPEQRTSFIAEAPTEFQGGLSTLATALTAQKMQRQAKLAEKLAELETAATFELSPLGQEVAKNKLKQSVLLSGVQAGRIPSEFASLFQPSQFGEVPLIPGLTPEQSREVYVEDIKRQRAQAGTESAKAQRAAFSTVEDLEQTFRNLKMTGPEFQIAKNVPNSPAELAYSKLKGSLAALARVSGQTSQLSDLDLAQQESAVLGPQLPVVGFISGTDSIANRLAEKLKVGRTLQKQEQTVGAAVDPKLEILKKLQAELAAEKAKRGIQ